MGDATGLSMFRYSIVNINSDNKKTYIHELGHKSMYNANAATFHYMVIIGKIHKNGKEYYRFYDPGREAVNEAKATSNTNLLEIDRNQSMLHGTYNEKQYTVTEVRKNL